ncbi:MAG TPA: response regulator [Alphaproteobacteria bacterium]|nr:response regulator [Alphaproteobacteria bacterium]
MSEKPHILIVDDDKGIRNMLRRYLAAEGFQVSEAADGSALRAALKDAKVDLVLLDLVMPGEDGLSLARDIRRHSSVPIIIVTGKGDLIDRVVGLEAGADDYLAKPFHLREVLARIRSVLRRARPPAQPSEEGKPPGAGEILGFLGWELDLTRRELQPPSGARVPLTTGEFELLRVFARNANRVLSRDQLLDLVKGRGWSAFDRSIDTQVARLRRKIERDPGKPELIKTVRGAGYIFAAAVTAR